MDEVLGSIAFIGLGSTQIQAVMNLDKWNELPGDVQKIIDEISPPMGVTMGQVFDGIVEENLTWLKESNPEIVFYDITPEEKAKWAEVIKPLWGKWVSEVSALGYPGQEMLDDWRNICKKYE